VVVCCRRKWAERHLRSKQTPDRRIDLIVAVMEDVGDFTRLP
jgi:hypothetical protein